MNAVTKMPTAQAASQVQPSERRSILKEMAAGYNMEPKAFADTLSATVFPKEGTNEEFLAFLVVAHEHKLNPLLKEIYAFPKKGGGIVPVVSVDGWCNLINRHPKFNGLEFDDHLDDKGQVTAITGRIWRKDRDKPIVVTEYMEECKRGTEPWKQWPRRMLRHKSLIQAARYAFGFAGIVDPDEAERMGADVSRMRDVTNGNTSNATNQNDGPPEPSTVAAIEHQPRQNVAVAEPVESRASDMELLESGRHPPEEKVLWGDPPPPDEAGEPAGDLKSHPGMMKQALLGEIAKLNTAAELDHIAKDQAFYAHKQKLSESDQAEIDLAFMRRSNDVRFPKK